MKIYVIVHKDIQLELDNCYEPLYVGQGKNTMNYLRDNSGDNIADKNDSYCELTGLYWIWKNSDEDIVGLVHYRRHFVKFLKPRIEYKERFIAIDRNPYQIIDKNDIYKLLNSNEMIVKLSGYHKADNWEIYHMSLRGDICERVKDIIRDIYHEYYQDFEVIMHEHRQMNCNMFICYKKMIEEYCEFLFPILEKLDEYEISKSGCRLHNRELGFVGEMLLGVWVRHNNIKYVICDVVNTQDKYLPGGVMGPMEFVGFMKKMFEKYVLKKR